MCCLKNMFWYAVILAHALSSVKGTVKTIKTPLVLSKCITQNMTAQHSCIRKLLTNETNIQLQITEEFYWHPTKRIRRECRVIPDEERSALFDAINALKNDTSLHPNVYDNFADYHTKRVVRSVHFGPNFFGWHRIFILRFEQLLRTKNPNITLCYWDNRLDYMNGNPRASLMFTSRFMGTSNGAVQQGPFAGWKTIVGHWLYRHIGMQGHLMSPYRINRILSQKRHRHITSGTARVINNFENMHNLVHAYIGGQMNNFNRSSQDPFFWIHHAFVDSIWELFRTNLQRRGINPQDDYVVIKNKMHHPQEFMDRLKPYRNLDGYSNYFMEHIYEYEPSPVCPECGDSPYLKCSKKKNVCYSITENEDLRHVQPKILIRNHLSNPLRNLTILSGSQYINEVVFIPIKIILNKAVRNNEIQMKCNLGDDELNLCNRTAVFVQSFGITYNMTFQNYVLADVSIPYWLYTFVAVMKPVNGSNDAYVSVSEKSGTPCRTQTPSADESRYKSANGFVRVADEEPRSFIETLDENDMNQFPFDPLSPDIINKRATLVFKCY